MMIVWDIVTDVILNGFLGVFFYRFLLILQQEEPCAVWHKPARKCLSFCRDGEAYATGHRPGRKYLSFCKDRETYATRPKQVGKIAVCVLPLLLWRGLIGYCPSVKRFFYGGQQVYQNSSSTILTMGFGLLVLFFCGCILYHGKKLLVLYLTLLFGAFSEMLRFFFYCLTIWFPEKAVDHYYNRAIEGIIEFDTFYQKITAVQMIWNVVYLILYLTALALVVYESKRAHRAADRLPRRRELPYLTAPALISLGFGMLIRSIMLITRQGEPQSIFDANSGLYLLIPAITCLCIAMMLGIVRLWSHIVGEEREKGELLVYQSRVEDMEQYVEDLERMQDGIRGMKHDIRNYMADIRALLALDEDTEAKKELAGYLSGMEQALKEYAIHYKTGNPVTDVLLNRHMLRARELGITTNWIFFFPEKLKIDPFDMSIILNNGLNNALESCRRLPQKQRWITLNGRSQGRIFLLEIKNAAQGSSQVVPDLGMKNMMRCARKYQGHMEWEHTGDTFRVTVLLQAKKNSEPS